MIHCQIEVARSIKMVNRSYKFYQNLLKFPKNDWRLFYIISQISKKSKNSNISLGHKTIVEETKEYCNLKAPSESNRKEGHKRYSYIPTFRDLRILSEEVK